MPHEFHSLDITYDMTYDMSKGLLRASAGPGGLVTADNVAMAPEYRAAGAAGARRGPAGPASFTGDPVGWEGRLPPAGSGRDHGDARRGFPHREQRRHGQGPHGRVISDGRSPQGGLLQLLLHGGRGADAGLAQRVRDAGRGPLRELAAGPRPGGRRLPGQRRPARHGVAGVVSLAHPRYEAAHVRLHAAGLRDRQLPIPGSLPSPRRRRRRGGLDRARVRAPDPRQPDRAGTVQTDDRRDDQRQRDAVRFAGLRSAPGAPGASRRRHAAVPREPGQGRDPVRRRDVSHQSRPREPRRGRPVDGRGPGPVRGAEQPRRVRPGVDLGDVGGLGADTGR